MRTTRTSDRLHCPADPIELMSSSRGNTPPAPLPLLLTLPHPPTENNSAMSQRKDTLRVRKMTKFVCYKKFMVRSSDLFCAHTDTVNTFKWCTCIYPLYCSLYSCAPSHFTFYNFRSLFTLSTLASSSLHCDNEEGNANIRKRETYESQENQRNSKKSHETTRNCKNIPR